MLDNCPGSGGGGGEGKGGHEEGLGTAGGKPVRGRVQSLARRMGRDGKKRGVLPRRWRYPQPPGRAGRKGTSSLTLKLQPQDPSSRKPSGSALACLWGLIPSPSLSLSQRVQWSVSPLEGTGPPLPLPWAPSRARPSLGLSGGTVWGPGRPGRSEQGRTGLAGGLAGP